MLVFPGEGAQYPDMLSDLCLHFDEVRAVFDRVDRLYAGHPARRPAQRLGVPAAGGLGGRARARGGAPDAARHRRRVGPDGERRHVRAAHAPARPGRRGARPQHRRALRRDRDGPARRRERRRARRVLAGPVPRVRRGGRAARHPGRRPARARDRRRDGAGHRRGGRRRAAPGDGQLPAPGGARGRGRGGGAGARDRRRPGAGVRGAAVRPGRAHAAVRPLRRRPARGLRRPAGGPGPHAAVVVHHRGAVPRRARRRSASCSSSTGRVRCGSARRSTPSTPTARASSSRPVRAGT